MYKGRYTTSAQFCKIFVSEIATNICLLQIELQTAMNIMNNNGTSDYLVTYLFSFNMMNKVQTIEF